LICCTNCRYRAGQRRHLVEAMLTHQLTSMTQSLRQCLSIPSLISCLGHAISAHWRLLPASAMDSLSHALYGPALMVS